MTAPFDQLRADLAGDIARLRAYGADAQVCALELVLRRLDEIEAATHDELLRLDEAAARCGLSREHLERLVRQGRIPNAGRKHVPRVRAGDLPPPKPGRHVAGPAPPGYDPDADARSLLSRRGGRSS